MTSPRTSWKIQGCIRSIWTNKIQSAMGLVTFLAVYYNSSTKDDKRVGMSVRNAPDVALLGVFIAIKSIQQYNILASGWTGPTPFCLTYNQQVRLPCTRHDMIPFPKNFWGRLSNEFRASYWTPPWVQQSSCDYRFHYEPGFIKMYGKKCCALVRGFSETSYCRQKCEWSQQQR